MEASDLLVVLSSLFLFLCIIFPQNAAAVGEAPPELPTGEFILAIQAKELASGAALANKQVICSFSNLETGEKLLVNEKTNENGTIVTYLDAGTWVLQAEADDPATPGKDFGGAVTIQVAKDSSLELFFQEVASASGEVVDEQGKRVADASLKIDCLQGFYEVDELNGVSGFRTDASGAFLIRFLPTGTCRITASKEEKTGFVNLETQRGKFKQAQIVLSTEVGGKKDGSVYLIAAIVLLVAAGGGLTFFYFHKGKRRERVEPTTPAPAARPKPKPKALKAKKAGKQEIRKTKKMRDVLNTLNERERKVAELLIANKGKLKQAKIFRELLIPKTSLSRVLASLERRNVVKLTPYGKTNIVELTEWFLT